VQTYDVCDGTPADLLTSQLCLDELSKDVRGDLRLVGARRHECQEEDCLTLTVEHLLMLELASHACDSALGALLDGRLQSKDLVSVFSAGSGTRRGMHTGTFVWQSAAASIHGRLSGMTNEGTHREPAFSTCQRCDERGVMEGRLCGRIVRTTDQHLSGAQVFAAYRLRFDPGEDGGQSPVAGTIEGLVVRTCSGRLCVTFDLAGQNANPRSSGDLSVQTRDLNGPTMFTSVVTWGSVTGLHLWHSSTLSFARAVSRVELTLVGFAVPATATAYDANGAVVATAVMTAPQRVPETLVLSAPGIVSVVVDSPSDEVLMPRVCWQI
jgi:hypothetical protein